MFFPATYDVIALWPTELKALQVDHDVQLYYLILLFVELTRLNLWRLKLPTDRTEPFPSLMNVTCNIFLRTFKN